MKLLEHLPTVHAGQQHVEDHGVGILGLDARDGGASVAGQDRLDAGVVQVHADDHEGVGIVLDDQHAGRAEVRHPASLWLRNSSSAATCARSASYSRALAIATEACSAN